MRHSADLAGQSVSLSIGIPAGFDAPLSVHHRAIGRWVAEHETEPASYTRSEARLRIERVFTAAVLDVLGPIKLADLRVAVLTGDESDASPAFALICDSVGSLDLNWIEKSNVLSNTLFTNVAPASWRAAAYKALDETLSAALPVFGYDQMLDELSAMYWDGETEDEAARTNMIEWHGADPEDIDEEMLPSAISARRPEWMIAANAAPMKHLPPQLRGAIRKLRSAYEALVALGCDGNAWWFNNDLFCQYIDGYEDSSTLPPLTLVPFDQFQRELDDVAQYAMQTGFMNVAGICPLADPDRVGAWFDSLRVGANFLLAAQELIDLDPANPGDR